MHFRHLLIAATFVAHAASAALPPQVELDTTLLRARQELDSGAQGAAIADFARAEQSKLPLPEEFYTGYSRALAASGDRAKAKAVLETYLNRFQEKGRLYKEALAQYVALDMAAAPAAASRNDVPHRCGRLAVPSSVPDAVWTRLEASDAYQLSPRPKTFDLDATQTTAFTSKHANSTLTLSIAKRLTPANDCVAALEVGTTTMQSTEVSVLLQHSSEQTPPQTTTVRTYYALGGVLMLGSEGAGAASRLVALEQIEGSLFPLQVGNTLRLAVRYDGQLAYSSKSECRVAERSEAAAIDTRLTGAAWRIDCTGSTHTDVPQYAAMNREGAKGSATYLEDYGVMLNEFRLEPPEPGRPVLLRAGESRQTSDPASKSVTTTTWTRYDWRVN